MADIYEITSCKKSDTEEIVALLADGWEPFAVTAPSSVEEIIWFKRLVE